MRRLFPFFFLLLFHQSEVCAGCQSLADVARKEAERRREMERQGVVAKVISSEDLSRAARGGNVTTSSVPPPVSAERDERSSPGPPSLRSLRGALQRLDRQICEVEDRLKVMRAQAEAERRAPLKIGRLSRIRVDRPQDQRPWQVMELEAKLKRLKQERLEAYETGRKAGYLPGELDGKGIIR